MGRREILGAVMVCVALGWSSRFSNCTRPDSRAESERGRTPLKRAGNSSSSRHASLDTVLKRAQNEEYLVYAIGLQSQILGQRTKPDKGLRKIAEETGGGYFELTRAADLNSTFSRAARDGKIHKLDVRVLQPGMTARARKTYVATKTDQ